MEIKKIHDFAYIHSEVKIKDAISCLNDSVYKVLFILDKNERLVGTLTDGDIRRSILTNFDLSLSVHSIMNKSPFSINQDRVSDISENEFLNYEKNYIPVLDEFKRIKYVLFFDFNFQTKTKNPTQVVIMAGGKGTRLLPLTRVIPKPLVPFGNKTIIENIMDQFLNSGFNKYSIILNYKSNMIKDYFKNSNYSIDFITEKEFLGTAGGLSLLKREKLKDPFYVSNCDILLNVDYNEALEVHKKSNVDITIFGALEDIDISYGILESNENGEFERVKEKPNLSFIVNTGIYILNPPVIDLVGKNERLDMPDLIDRAKKAGMRVKVFPVPDKMTDIGQWEYYKKFL